MIVRILMYPFKLLFSIIMGVIEKLLATLIILVLAIALILHFLGVDVSDLVLNILNAAFAEGNQNAVNNTINETASKAMNNSSVSNVKDSIIDKVVDSIAESFKESL